MARSPASATTSAKDDDAVFVRILVDHDGHRVDSVVELTLAEAAAAAEAGWADPHPDAVAHARAIASTKDQ